MFTQKRKAYYSKILGFKSTSDFEEFAKRYLKFLEKQPLTKNRVMSGFFILTQIQKTSLSNNNLINLQGIKNQYIKKYSQEVLNERKKGNGSLNISKYLFENHRVKVSRGTIEKFYKQNGL